MVSINQLLAGSTALSLAGWGLVKTGIGSQIQRDVFGQAYKTGKSSVTNCYNCLTAEGKKSDKYIGSLELVTSEIWTGMNSDLRSDFLSRGFPILNVSTINPEKNAEIIKAWTYEAVNCNRVYLNCNKELVKCNDNLPKALNDTNIAQKEIIAAKDAAKAQIDPLLIRQGKCEELEDLKEEVKRLSLIEKDHIKLTGNIQSLEKELNQTKTANDKELNQTKTLYQERIDNLNKIAENEQNQTKIKIDDLKESHKKELNASNNDLEDMTKKMKFYKKLYEDAVWFPVRSEL